MRKYLIILILLSYLPLATRGQTIGDIDLFGLPKTTQAKSLRYWFDDDGGSVRTVNSTSGNYLLDISSLVEGLHTLHYQIVDNEGAVAYISSVIFLKSGVVEGAGDLKPVKLTYWFDDETTIQQLDYTGGFQMIDASRLEDGLHTIHYQVLCNNGSMTSSKSSIFLRLSSDTETTAIKSLRYWFDDEVSAVNIVDVANGTQALDISKLKKGLHTLCYQLVDSKGNLGAPKTRIFMKNFDKVIADGQNRITEYQYWLNRNSQAMKTVELNNADNPYTLISLLPMQKEPIQSDFFYFEITNGQPIVYAKNLLHIRFYDAAGYFIDGEKSFVDYSVKQELTDIEFLESGVGATTAMPTENDIKWYKLYAEPGDSLQFKLDRAATIQLFAPSGQEVHSASGAEAVRWNGLHVSETGTYYLALHDVTATQGTTISIDYNHIDKYAVLRQDVSVVGNGGYSTITFEGNGYKDLYAVDLYNAQGDTIHSAVINYISNAEVSITFDFTNANLGKYNALFHFTEDDKVFPNIITVEEAKEIELELDIKYPGTFLLGTSAVYTINVTNKGNATAYDVPMEIYLSAEDSLANIEAVVFKDNKGKVYNNFALDEIDKDSIDDETVNYIKGLLDELNGLQLFIVKNDSTDGGEYGFTDHLLTIPANSSLTFYIEIKSSSSVNLKVRIPSEWITIHTENDVVGSRNQRRSASDSNLCCEKEKWECIVNSVADVIGFVPVAGCASAVVDLGTFTVFEIACADGNTIGNKGMNFLKSLVNNNNKMESAISKVINTFLGCIGAGILKQIKKLKEELDELRRSRNLVLKQSHNYNKLHMDYLSEYDKKMIEADKLYKQGNIKEAEILEEDAKGLKWYSEYYKNLSNDKYDEAEKIVADMGKVEAKIGEEQMSLANAFAFLNNGLKMMVRDLTCSQEILDANANCPPNPKEGAGTSNMRNSCEPNEILGYVAESGSKAVKDGLTDIYYVIQFENDTVFATAPAHDIYLTDTLDVNLFDLSTYRPTKIKIGEKSMDLTGERNFISTLDMRPEIYAIAQIEGTIDDMTGIVRWHISSLDPMTMEPIKDALVGVLPPNFDGSGMGEASFDISLKNDLPHGTEIPNRSGNVFDSNETVLTPTYVNVIDRIAPTSRVTDVQQLSDTTAAVSIKATDELSGPWRYDVYVQYGRGSAWWKAAENIPIDTTATVKIYDGIDHGFYVVVTDSAGNVERKQAMREMTLNLSTTVTGDVNADGQVGIADIVAVTSYMVGNISNVSLAAADVNGDGQVGIADIVAITEVMAGTTNANARQPVPNKTYFIRRKTKNDE